MCVNRTYQHKESVLRRPTKMSVWKLREMLKTVSANARAMHALLCFAEDPDARLTVYGNGRVDASEDGRPVRDVFCTPYMRQIIRAALEVDRHDREFDDEIEEHASDELWEAYGSVTERQGDTR